METVEMNIAMIPTAGLLAAYCSLVLLASLAGGWLLLAMRLNHTRLQTAVSFVAGLMLAMALLHFLPHASHQLNSVDLTAQWALAGFLVMFFLQRFFPHHHHDVSEGVPESGLGQPGQTLAPDPDHHAHAHRTSTVAQQSNTQLSWAVTTVGMGLHSLVGGIALGAAVASESSGGQGLVGLGTALVIILHKPFDAMAVATLMTAGECSRLARHLINALFACVTPLGAVLFYIGAIQFFTTSPAFLGSALAFCAGTFLCIACADLLPELQFHTHDRIRLSLALLLGIAVAVIIRIFGE